MTAEALSIDVRQFGAKGDGKTKDHAAIQRAVDECAARGGGEVRVTAGVYLCGTIELKSRTRLYLDAGAVIAGSPDPDDYRKVLPGDHYNTGVPNQPHNRDQALIVARKADGVGVAGPGEIDARGWQFYDRDTTNANRKFAVGKWRPGPTLLVVDCTDVRLCDFLVRDNPFFAVNLIGCTGVGVRDLRITNDFRFQNADGIHVSCCRKVGISGCRIDSEDDALCFYTHREGLTDAPAECSGVTVSDCVLTSSCSGVRIGLTGDGVLRDMTFTNLVITRAFKGIDFLCTARNQYKGETSAAGPAVSDMVFSTIVVRESQFGITANVLPDAKQPAGIRDLLFSGMKVRSRRGNYLAGHEDVPIRGITFRDVDFTVTGELDKPPAKVPDPIDLWGTRVILPHAVFVRHAEDVAFRDCRIRWDGAAGGWSSAFHAADGRNIDCRSLRADPFRVGAEPITSERAEVRPPASGPRE